MSNFPSFEPEDVRAEDKEYYDKELWQPSWKCFCCQDTGKIQQYLVKRVMPNYNYHRNKIPICQKVNCSESNKLAHLIDHNVLDTRFTPNICAELDLISREDWKQTTESQFEQVKNRSQQAITKIAQKTNMRKRDRDQYELAHVDKHHGLARGDWEIIKEEVE